MYEDLTLNLEVERLSPIHPQLKKKYRSKNHISGYNTKQLKNRKFKPISKLTVNKKI